MDRIYTRRNHIVFNSREEEEEDEEYVNPASVGANKEGEEMLENETIEQFEDRVLNKRAAHLNTILKSRLDAASQSSVRFSELPIRRIKKAMAQNFYSLLVLQKVRFHSYGLKLALYRIYHSYIFFSFCRSWP